MDYLGEVGKTVNLPYEEVLSGYKVEVFSGKALAISNFKKILIYTSDHLVVSVKGGVVDITGSDIKIRQLDSGTITISGKLENINLGAKRE